MKSARYLALLLISFTVHAAPDAPQVTVGADLKRLRFDWLPVAGAIRYELWQRATSTGAWLKVQERPASATNTVIAVSAHLLDWRGARWRIDACDSSGCTQSAELSATNLMRDSVGYFKPVDIQESSYYFGRASALSADGRTLAVEGGDGSHPALAKAFVFVYKRAGSEWVFDSRLSPDDADLPTPDGTTLSLSADGSVLVWGTPYNWTSAPVGSAYTGAAYVFRRTAGAWQREQKFALTDIPAFFFGHDVDVSDDGNRFAVSYVDQAQMHYGHVQIYQRIAGAWQLEKSLPVRTGGSARAQCTGIALSGDGLRLARSCGRDPNDASIPGEYVEVYSAPRWRLDTEIALDSRNLSGCYVDINADGTRLVASHGSQALSVWRLNGALWEPDSPNGILTPINVSSTAVAMSRNGNVIVQSDPTSDVAGVGAIYPPFATGIYFSGITRVYLRRGGQWTLQQTLKGNTATRQGFGSSVALGDNGSVLAVGASFEPSAASGVDGDQNDTSAPISGAVWLY